MINPQRGVAAYLRLAALLREEITSGRIPPGSPLPSEIMLQQTHDLSRETVRRAIGVLRSEGHVVVRRGHGVQVRETPERQDLTVAAGAVLTSRMPTVEEAAERGMDDGVPLLVVTGPDGLVELFPADLWQVRGSS